MIPIIRGGSREILFPFRLSDNSLEKSMDLVEKFFINIKQMS
jgi:hypothetical protein